MIVLFIISVIIFFSYITFVAIKYGIQNSISDSYYLLPKKYRTLVFVLFSWGFSIPLMIVSLDQTGNAIAFFAGAGIAFVGAAAAFNDDLLTYKVHMVSAIVGILASQLAVLAVYHQQTLFAIFILTVILMIGLTLAKKDVKYFWWIEVVAFSTYILSVGLHFLDESFSLLRS